jgi:glycosyltransferase involved in cell wall biosynthesis
MTWLHLTASTFFGGPERQMLGLVRHLPPEIRSHFASFSENNRCDAFLNEVRNAGFDATKLEYDSPHLRAAIRELVALIRKLNATILFTHTYKPNLLGRIAARRAGIPHAVVSRGWTGENWKVRAYEKLDRFNLRFADCVVAVSNGQADKIRRAGVPENRIVVIRNAARLGVFEKRTNNRSEILNHFGDTRPSHIILAAGRLSPEKGFDVLINAASQVVKENPHTGFVIFGDGVERAALSKQIQTLGLQSHVALAGFTDQLDQYLPNAEIVVLPSRSEGLPNVALEASAAGVPVVATAVGGTPEVVAEGETGFLVPSEDAIAMAKRIGQLLGNDELRKQFGQAGRVRMEEEFSFEAQAERYVSLYESVAKPVRVAA